MQKSLVSYSDLAYVSCKAPTNCMLRKSCEFKRSADHLLFAPRPPLKTSAGEMSRRCTSFVELGRTKLWAYRRGSPPQCQDYVREQPNVLLCLISYVVVFERVFSKQTQHLFSVNLKSETNKIYNNSLKSSI